MNLGQIRAMLQRQLQDISGVEWNDTGELNALINMAYYNLQKEVFKRIPDAHLYVDTAPTVVGTSWYPLDDTFGIHRVGYKADGTATSHSKLQRKDYEDIVDLTGTTTYYTQKGQWIGIFPAPSAAVADGIELWHTPIMSLALDADVPRLKLPLHYPIVLWARMIAIGDTGEEAGETRERLKEVIDDLPLWYEIMTDSPDRLRIEGV